tara:strand:+ start:554 stop:979 length:426 start_codon:yes stop_codon:yes gene_type:complete
MQPDDLTFPAYRAMLANARAQGLEVEKPSMDRLEEARQLALILALDKRHIPVLVEDFFLKVGPHRAAIVENGWVVPTPTGQLEVRLSIKGAYDALCLVEYARVRDAFQRIPMDANAYNETLGILGAELAHLLDPEQSGEEE